MKNLKLAVQYWKSIVIMLVILHLSFAPPSEFSKIPTFENEDKLIHFLMYFALIVVLIYDTYRCSIKHCIPKKTFITFTLIFSIVLGGVIEIMQPLFFAPRTGSWFDLLADSAGVVAGWSCMKWIFKKVNISFFSSEKNSEQ